MRKTLLAIACVVALGLSAPGAEAIDLTIGGANYLGYVTPGVPTGENDEEAYILYLTGMAAPSTENDVTNAVIGVGGNQNDTQSFVRSAYFNGADFPAPQFVGPKIDNTNSFNSTGFLYILAKYGAGQGFQASYVWYSPTGFFGQVTVPTGALSHISTFNGVTVPDGGMTLMLLGGALVGLGALRRKFRA